MARMLTRPSAGWYEAPTNSARPGIKSSGPFLASCGKIARTGAGDAARRRGRAGWIACKNAGSLDFEDVRARMLLTLTPGLLDGALAGSYE
jgi:hypothetical protein